MKFHRCNAFSILCISFIFPLGAIAADGLKTATTQYVVAYLTLQQLRSGECGKTLGARPQDQSAILKTIELAKPFMTPKELVQLRSGELQQEMIKSVEPIVTKVLAEARNIGKGNREVCLFAIGYSAGRMQEARDMLKFSGGPAL